MKNLLPFILFILSLSWLAPSCSKGTASQASLLYEAEQAYSAGLYPAAQQLADSVLAVGDMAELSVNDLCRLSLLYVYLGERAEEEANIANAARALDAAASRDSDSTLTFIQNLSVDDRAGLVLVEAVSEGSRHIINIDSLYFGVDSISF